MVALSSDDSIMLKTYTKVDNLTITEDCNLDVCDSSTRVQRTSSILYKRFALSKHRYHK